MTLQTHGQVPATDALKPMSPLQARQTREFIDGLASESSPYWDIVEDFNPWYEGWRMNSWHIEGQSPFGGAIVPPLLVSHFVLSVQFDATRPFSIGSIHTYHDSEILAPIPVGATVRITTRAIDKFEKRGRRYVRHGVEVTDVESGLLFFRETRDILSL